VDCISASRLCRNCFSFWRSSRFGKRRLTFETARAVEIPGESTQPRSVLPEDSAICVAQDVAAPVGT
jgi:hypothetical protein